MKMFWKGQTTYYAYSIIFRENSGHGQEGSKGTLIQKDVSLFQLYVYCSLSCHSVFEFKFSFFLCGDNNLETFINLFTGLFSKPNETKDIKLCNMNSLITLIC
jgi:hypothetical protein